MTNTSDPQVGLLIHSLRPDTVDSTLDRNRYLWCIKKSSLKKHVQELPGNKKREELQTHWNRLATEKVRRDPLISPVLFAFFLGMYDQDCPLSTLYGIVPAHRKIVKCLRRWWASCVTTDGVFASRVAQVVFPAPTGININMMPVVLGEACSVPQEYWHYLPLLCACPLSRSDWGYVGYLTIQESVILEENATQRRTGLHTDSPGLQARPQHGGNRTAVQIVSDFPATLAWGRGYFDTDAVNGQYDGGIFLASNVAASTRVWNARVMRDEAIGSLGDVEHLRSCLGQGYVLDAGEMVWITDKTPHESLPLKAGTYRQFFRLVTSQIGGWYAKHSTPNPLGVQPGVVPTEYSTPWYRLSERKVAPVEILDYDKFEQECVALKGGWFE